LKIKYFTALVLPNQIDPVKHINQQTYVRAIETFIPEIEVCYGRFLETRKRLPLVNPLPGNTMAAVSRMEEKGSDVNLGVHLVYDACRNLYDYGVVISNDTDLAEAIRISKEEFGKTIGVISPQHPIAGDIKEQASFFRYIRPQAIRTSQLPNPIPGTSIRKPPGW